MTTTKQALPEIDALPGQGLDRERFQLACVDAATPCVLRGLVDDWPLVQVARRGDEVLAAALLAMASPEPVDAVMIPPERGDRLFYAADGQGFNFLRQALPIAQVLDQVMRYRQFTRAPAVAVQSALASRCLPDFERTHGHPLLGPEVPARIWLGTALLTPAHFDESANIASVIAGRRRFTLLPPEQVGNLAVGPIGHAPTGTPISLVDLRAPDLVRFPRAAAALQAARFAELGPGDAIYIPPLWWHQVESCSPLNLMANHWWPLVAGLPSALPALLHARLALGALPAAQRRAWQALFAHWVFEADDGTIAHLPPDLLGVHGPLTPALRRQLRAFIAQQLVAEDEPGA